MADSTENSLTDLDCVAVLLDELARGDPAAAEDLIAVASRYLLSGETMPEELAMWLGQALAAISPGFDKQGEEPSKALGLKKKQGRRAASEEFQRLIAESVLELPEGRHKGLSKDGKFSGAYSIVAERFNVSENAVEKYYQAYGERILEERRVNQEVRDKNEER